MERQPSKYILFRDCQVEDIFLKVKKISFKILMNCEGRGVLEISFRLYNLRGNSRSGPPKIKKYISNFNSP